MSLKLEKVIDFGASVDSLSECPDGSLIMKVIQKIDTIELDFGSPVEAAG